MTSDIINFYRGEPNRSKHVLDEVWVYTPSQLEMKHDFIQWMFPLNEASACQPHSPVMTQDDIIEFSGDVSLKLKMLESVRVFMKFLRASTDTWVSKFDHNQLRITRMLRCLVLVGLNSEATARLSEILMLVSANRPEDAGPNFMATSIKYWTIATYTTDPLQG